MSDTIAFPVYIVIIAAIAAINAIEVFRNMVLSLFSKDIPLMNQKERAYVMELAQKPSIMLVEWVRVSVLAIMFLIISITGMILAIYTNNLILQGLGALMLVGTIYLDIEVSRKFYLVKKAISLHSEEMDDQLERAEDHDETQYVMEKLGKVPEKANGRIFQNVDELDKFLKRKTA